MPSSFHGLTVYKLAAALGDELYAVVMRWPRSQRFVLGDQLVRAADSVGANIAEGVGRWYPQERRRLLYIARGSLYEMEHWVARAEARGMLEPGRLEVIDEIGKALNGLIRQPAPD